MAAKAASQLIHELEISKKKKLMRYTWGGDSTYSNNLSLIKGARPSTESESEMWPHLVKEETLKG